MCNNSFTNAPLGLSQGLGSALVGQLVGLNTRKLFFI